MSALSVFEVTEHMAVKSIYAGTHRTDIEGKDTHLRDAMLPCRQHPVLLRALLPYEQPRVYGVQRCRQREGR